MAELIDLNKEFHLGNKFTLDAATHFSGLSLLQRLEKITKFQMVFLEMMYF